jgi:hypothetical protein
MKPVLAALVVIFLGATLRISAAQDATHVAQHAAADGAAGLISSWTLVALEDVGAIDTPTRLRSPHGLLVLDGAGYVFEYFSGSRPDADALPENDPQRAFAEHGGFWGRYTADAAAGRIAFEAAAGVSPSVSDLEFSRRYELECDRLIVTSTDEPQAQRNKRWIWQRVPTVANLTPGYRQVLGFWQHVEESRIDLATGEALRTSRRAPSVIVYTPSGLVGVHFPQLGRTPFAADMPTAEEAQAASRGYIGYFGALSVYDGAVAHNILGGVWPSPGAILRRAAAVDGDDLVVTLENTGAFISGEPAEQATTVHLRRLSDADDMLPRAPQR